jgi:hypothetical protein
MYNFLVTSEVGAWDSRMYEYRRDRFVQAGYTPPPLKAKFESLTPEAIAELKTLPTLFAYEGMQHEVRVGHITRISDRRDGIYIEFDFDPRIPPIPFAEIEPLRLRLDLKNRLELGTTHWAIKDEDLLGILAAAGVVDAAVAGPQLPPPVVGLRQDSWIKLGFGGFGTVYRVTDERLGLDFAVKVFDPSPFITSQADARARFLREAGLLFRLHHQHVIRIYDAGEFLNGQPFIKMEYFDGLDLQKAQAQRSFARDEALSLVRHLAGAVHHAHERGIVHRDIKPSNILVSQSLGDFRLIDFGLGIVVEEAMERARLTTSAQQFGNAFAAPEQLQDPKSIDPRLDVYSVGAVWFWLHSGRSPHGAGLDEAIAELDLDPHLQDLMRRSMLPMPRRPSAKELLEGLDARLRAT